MGDCNVHRAPIGSYRSVIVQSAAMKVTHERDKNSGKENLATITLDLPNFHFQSNIYIFLNHVFTYPVTFRSIGRVK